MLKSVQVQFLPSALLERSMKKYARTFILYLRRMIKEKARIRVKRIAGVDYPGELEWVRPDEIGLACWRKTYELNKLGDPEESIQRTIADGGFVNRSEIEGRQKWLIARMIHHGLIDQNFQVTDLGREVYDKQCTRK
jgi:hypothetical protein